MGGGLSSASIGSISKVTNAPTSGRKESTIVSNNDAELSERRIRCVENFISSVYSLQNKLSTVETMKSLVESKQSR
jgi:hypothetical protein